MNAFFGLVVVNLTNLVVLSGLVGVLCFPADLVLYGIVPGTGLGVLIGDLVYTWLAVRRARETGRAHVTTMPFGIRTPSMFRRIALPGRVPGALAAVVVGTAVDAMERGLGMAEARPRPRCGESGAGRGVVSDRSIRLTTCRLGCYIHALGL